MGERLWTGKQGDLKDVGNGILQSPDQRGSANTLCKIIGDKIDLGSS